MIRLHENKSQIWFKVLSNENLPIDGTSENWHLPKINRGGNKVQFLGDIKVLSEDATWVSNTKYQNATWLVSNPTVIYKTNSMFRIYVAQLWGTPIYERPGMIWVQEAALLREATNFDLRPFGIHRAFKHHF